MSREMRSTLLLFIFFVHGSAINQLGDDPTPDPSYDHQTETYDATYAPTTVNAGIPIAPFFSPEHSTDTLTAMIEGAVESVDIMTPSAGSWLSACGGYVDDEANDNTCAPGCTPEVQRTETFPLFPALLNALHRGVGVRLMTNDYGTPDCADTITMLQYLALNGADVRYYTTTAYLHAKYQAVDGGRVASVSSINWSKTSMTKNREAGALINAEASSEASELTAYMQSVFEHDFEEAYALVPGNWSAAQLLLIKDPAELPVVLPVITPCDGCFVTPAPYYSTDEGNNTNSAALLLAPKHGVDSAPSTTTTTTVQASPDSAWASIEASLAAAKTSLKVAMYQVTTSELCDQILDLHAGGVVGVSLLVSSRIYGEDDCVAAQQCYAKLYAGGLTVRKSSNFYSYSHDKYWLVDGASVAWSTGNWSPSDYPPNHANEYPPYGEPGWFKANRDFTVYSDDSQVVGQFEDLFAGDWSAPYTYNWEPDYDVICGY